MDEVVFEKFPEPIVVEKKKKAEGDEEGEDEA